MARTRAIGASADGSLASLVVDFLVLVEDRVETVEVPWQTGPLAQAELANRELEIRDRGDAFEIRHRGEDIRKIRVLAPDGSELVDAHHLGLSVTGDLHTQTWRPESRPPPGSTFEVSLDRGYRHV